MKWKDHKKMKRWCQDETMWRWSVLRIRWQETAGWWYRWWRVDRIEFREKKDHPSPPVESTTGPYPTSSQRCRTPQHCKFHSTFAPPLDNEMWVDRRKICRGQILAYHLYDPGSILGTVMWQVQFCIIWFLPLWKITTLSPLRTCLQVLRVFCDIK